MRSAGFTLTELLITLAVASILLTVGVPSYRGMVQSSRITAQTNDVVTALHLGRSEAVKRGLTVSVCASADGQTCSGALDWSTGWIVFTDDSGADGQVNGTDRVLRAWNALSGDAVLTGTSGFVQYRPLGVCSAAATLSLSIPEGGSQGAARQICISGPGRPFVTTGAC